MTIKRTPIAALLTTKPDRPIRRCGYRLPAWLAAVDKDISASDVDHIAQYGVGANAHPACFYRMANDVMSVHGDDVLAYLEQWEIDLPTHGLGWSALGSAYLCAAVELWCSDAVGY